MPSALGPANLAFSVNTGKFRRTTLTLLSIKRGVCPKHCRKKRFTARRTFSGSIHPGKLNLYLVDQTQPSVKCEGEIII
jgi:hypothetical protein